MSDSAIDPPAAEDESLNVPRVVSRREKARLKKEAAEPKMDKKELIDKLKKERQLEDKLERARWQSEAARAMKLKWQESLLGASNFKDGGQLNLSWQKLVVVDPIIYNFQADFGGLPLIALRLVGCELTHLPEDIGKNLKTLQVLSLPSNHLSSIPDSICEMTNLREMNLLKNKLTLLPDRIGFLCSLQSLLVANNCIEKLPNSFGGLNLLTRIDLECNNLRLLPENLDNMLNMQCFNCNRNQLIRLPRCIARMPSLTSLSCAFNKIQYIPNEIIDNRGIKILRMSNNLITLIPDQIGKLKKLKEVAFDYNDIKKLPLSFYKLTKLQNLRIEGNPKLTDPPAEILVQGAAKVVQYCADLYHEREVGRMKEIIRGVQDICRQIEIRNLADPSLFQPRTIPEGQMDEFFAVQMSYLWNDLLPTLQKIWHEEGMLGVTPQGINSFGFSEDDVMWAFNGFADSYGLLLRQEKAMFKRCSCVDKDGKRIPCVPPKVGYMCLRMATLLKSRIIMKREKDERLWIEYKINGVNDAIKRSKHEAELYLTSEEGKLFVETTAYDKAEELTMEGAVEKRIQKRLDEANDQKKSIIKKFTKKKTKVQKERDKKTAVIEVELHKLRLEEASARAGYMKDSITARITELMTKVARMEETLILERLQQECDEECKKVDDEMYAEAETSSDSEFSLDSDDLPDSDDETEEANKKRFKYKKKQREKELYAKFAPNEPNPIVEVITEFVDETKRAIGLEVKRKLMHSSVLKDYKEFKAFKKKNDFRGIKKIFRGLKFAKDAASIRIKRLMSKAHGDFDEVQKEMSHEIKFQYMQYQIKVAKEKAENEFAVIDSVRLQWGGAGLQVAFLAWKKYIKEAKSRIRKDLRNEYRTRTKALETVMESVRLARVQVALWDKCTDIYTDIPFWRHKHHGGITNTEPGIQHFLPPQFYIPSAPKPLPPDVGFFSTSEEEEEIDELDSPRTKKKKMQRKKQADLRKHRNKRAAERMKQAKEDAEKREDSRDPFDDDKEYAFGYIPENTNPFSPRFSTPRKWGAYTDPIKAELEAAGWQQQQQQQEYSAPQQYGENNYYDPNYYGQLQHDGSSAIDANYNYTCNDSSGWHGSYYDQDQYNIEDSGYSGDVDQSHVGTMPSALVNVPPLINLALNGEAQATSSSGRSSRSAAAGGGGGGGGSSSDPPSDTHAVEGIPFAASTSNGHGVDTSQATSIPELPPVTQFTYGPDSLRYNKPGRANKKAYHEEERIPKALAKRLAYGQYTNLFNKVDEADAFMNSKDYISDRISFDGLVATDIELNKQVVMNKAEADYDKAETVIRRRRQQFSKARADTYKNQMNLRFQKPQDDDDNNRPKTSQKDAATDVMLESLMKQDGSKGKDLSSIIKNQSPVDLLRLSGGTVEMIHVEGPQGMKLRSILASRALLIRDRLVERAVERKLIKNPEKSFYERNFGPFWLESLPSSSEEEEDEKGNKESFAKRKRREAKQSRKVMEDKLATGNILK